MNNIHQINTERLTIEKACEIIETGAKLVLSDECTALINKCREFLDDKIERTNEPLYGITTGFGEFQKVAVPKEMSNQLSTNLILSHCTAAGEPYADEIVRGVERHRRPRGPRNRENDAAPQDTVAQLR